VRIKGNKGKKGNGNIRGSYYNKKYKEREREKVKVERKRREREKGKQQKKEERRKRKKKQYVNKGTGPEIKNVTLSPP
jgi:hypothetical protein